MEQINAACLENKNCVRVLKNEPLPKTVIKNGTFYYTWIVIFKSPKACEQAIKTNVFNIVSRISDIILMVKLWCTASFQANLYLFLDTSLIIKNELKTIKYYLDDYTIYNAQRNFIKTIGGVEKLFAVYETFPNFKCMHVT